MLEIGKMSRGRAKWFVCCGFLFWMLGTWGARADNADLLRGAEQINQALEKVATCRDGARYSIGVWPFNEADTPLHPSSAYLLYARFVAHLNELKPDCTVYYSGDGVKANLAYLNRVELFQKAGTAPLEEIEQKLQSVNFTLSGSLQEQNGDVSVVFRLVNRKTGAIITTTDPLAVSKDYQAGRCSDGALQFDVAVSSVAELLHMRLPELGELILAGGYYANTNAQTDFGRYLLRQISAATSEAYWEPVSGRKLKIRDLKDADATRLFRQRGLTVSSKQMRQVTLGAENAKGVSYSLKARYWQCDNAIKLLVHAQNAEGQTVVWRGSVRLDDIPPGLDLEPPLEEQGSAAIKPIEPVVASEMSFTMSSSRGDNPVFQPGEEMVLSLRFSKSAWLYCFYTDAQGETIQFLPNQFQNKKDPNRNFYMEKVLHLLPDAQKEPVPDAFELKFNDTTVGVEAVRCIATSRDVTNELPQSLRGLSFDPIPASLTARMRQIFESIPNNSVTERYLTVTVMK